MERGPHENVATVLVDPAALPALEVHLMSLDLRLWPVETAPICVDGPRRAFQLRRQLLTARRGEWDDAVDWVPAWIAFGETWSDGIEPIPWTARRTLYAVLSKTNRTKHEYINASIEHPADHDAGAEERQPRQQRVGAIDEHVEHHAPWRTGAGCGEPTGVVAVELALEPPPGDAGTGEGR